MAAAFAAFGVIALIVIFYDGYHRARAVEQKGLDIKGAVDPDAKPGTDPCDAACRALIFRHRISWSAKLIANQASQDRDAIIAELGRAIAASAVLLAAAIATGFVRIIGSILAVPLWTAWVTSHLYVTSLLGRLAGADERARYHNEIWKEAVAMETIAMNQVITDCTADKASACIGALHPY